jgi:hypothetical protein
MKYLSMLLTLSCILATIPGCLSSSDLNKSPVYQESPPPSAPTTPGNTGTLTDPTRNSLNQTGASEQNAGSSSPAGATGGTVGQ